MVVVGVLTALAFALRFYKINHPDQVVFVPRILSLSTSSLTITHPSFDEVHFGKFAAYYILREYYFDVHPPFAKLLFGLAGWFVGFDGQFNFENIGDDYTENHVPYVGMRALPAILGSLTVPIVYGIMKESGYGTVIAAFSASIVLFGMYGYISATSTSQFTLTFSFPDNAHVAQSRLILLDATLIFFLSLTIYSYVRFRKLRYMYVQSTSHRSGPLLTAV
jgi:dolichyl-phosphate-mannose-protein mannosyltransferase